MYRFFPKSVGEEWGALRAPRLPDYTMTIRAPFYLSPRGRLLNLWKPSTQFSNRDPLCPPSGSIEHQQTNIWCASSNGIPCHTQAPSKALCCREAGPKQPSMAASLKGCATGYSCFHHVGTRGAGNLFYFPVKHLERSIDAFFCPHLLEKLIS